MHKNNNGNLVFFIMYEDPLLFYQVLYCIAYIIYYI